MKPNRLDDAFTQARQQERALLLPYLTCGYPDRDSFVDIAVAVLEAGADALELGIPFSDPLLDGPSIQRSQYEALRQGVTPRVCLELAAAIHERNSKPLIFFGAYNPILAYGLERFCAEAVLAGAAGLIVPDLPMEEQDDIQAAAKTHGLHVIQLVAPTSTSARLQGVCAVASGFVYCISVTGVTGARAGVSELAKPLVERVRTLTQVPVAVGFGIAGPEQAAQVASFSDGVIVGSALINLLRDTESSKHISAVAPFIAALREACRQHPVPAS